MKRAIALVVAAVVLWWVWLVPALADQPADLHCPDGGVKTEANEGTQEAINSTVLPAGTQFCVKAGPGNTGILTADGSTTLQEYAPDGKDVSYFVVYGETSPSPTPEPTPSPTPEPPPSPTPEPPVDEPPVDEPPVDTPPDRPDKPVKHGQLPVTGPVEDAILLGAVALALALMGSWAIWRTRKDRDAV